MKRLEGRPVGDRENVDGRKEGGRRAGGGRVSTAVACEPKVVVQALAVRCMKERRDALGMVVKEEMAGTSDGEGQRSPMTVHSAMG